jgi:signal transduction histidine kinase
MTEADKSCQRLSALQASVEASEGNLGRKADAVKSEVTSEMKLILQRSREEMREMKQLLQELKAQKSRLSAADRDADFLFEDDIMPAAGGRR